MSEPPPAHREMTADHRYLLLPVRTGAPKRRLALLADGQVAREFEIELAEGEPGFWTFLDLEPFRGRRIELRADGLPQGSALLNAVRLSDQLPDAEHPYGEPQRPQFHFTSRRGWLNDPNGLVYSQGEWHLYYQHNPYGWDWGNMHWGHAVSPDLVHWRELPIALYPRRFGDWCFSGSAVADRENTSGFRSGKNELLVAAFTSTGRGECIVYSNDRGRTWQEYASNPVVVHQGRDPRLLWHAPSRQWVMAVYDDPAGGRDIAFYTSPDLKHWQYRSRVAGFYECPDLYELPVEGAPVERRWVLSAADGEYLLGQFDGQAFHPEGGKHRLWYGNFYAAQTYSNAPSRKDGRRVQIGWGNGITFPGAPFNQQMTVPVELRLEATSDGPRLRAEPVRELRRLYRREHRWKDLALGEERPLPDVAGDLLALDVELQPGVGTCGLTLRGIPLTYDPAAATLSCGKVTAPLPEVEGRVRLHVLVDRGSIEVFANGGRVAMSVAAAFSPSAHGVSLFARGPGARVRRLVVHQMASAWE